MNKYLSFFLRLFVTAAIFFALFKFIPYQELIEAYKESQIVYIGYSLLAFFFALMMGVTRWWVILADLGVRVSFRETVYAFFSGMFFNLFFPSLVAGDFFRGFALHYRHGNTKRVASSVVMDRFSGMLALGLIAVIALLFGWRRFIVPQVLLPLTVLLAGLSVMTIIVFSKRIFLFLISKVKKDSAFRQKLISFHDQLHVFKTKPIVFVRAMSFSILIQMAIPVSFFLAARAFGVEAGLLSFLILVPLIITIASIPITIAGAGAREAASVYLFTLIGVEHSISLSVSLLNLVFMVSFGILGGVLYVAVYHRWLQRRP